jgi:RNA polymerase sigma-70 factor (ECF subfamily)
MPKMIVTGPGKAGAVSVEELNAAIVAAHAALARRAFYLTRDRDCANDLVQRTVERACSSRHQLRPASSPARWLSSIMTTQFIDECRRYSAGPFSRAQPLDCVAAPDPTPTPLWASLDMDDIVAAARGLPPRFRQPFELHALARMSHRAIALRLGLPMGTIATRIHRAKRLLRKSLTGCALRRLQPPPAMALAGGRSADHAPERSLPTARPRSRSTAAVAIVQSA